MSVFERHPRSFKLVLGVLSLLVAFGCVELVLRVFLGLGDPVLYQSSPLYGYRLQPNQLVHRGSGVEIRVNNLGLRADRDWDSTRSNKVLFLGNSVTYGGSYVNNSDLFSHRAVEGSGYLGGNAGVNGWGIENIRALVADLDFTPASVYVSVLQEMDFYRGLSKLAGKPFWTHKPRFAAGEVLTHFHLQQFEQIYEGHDAHVSWREFDRTIARSARSLKEMDEYLKARGFRHLMYLSTNRSQLFEGMPADSLVAKYLEEFGIVPILIRERPELTSLDSEAQEALFHDWNHLSREGHALWARIIRNDLQHIIHNIH